MMPAVVRLAPLMQVVHKHTSIKAHRYQQCNTDLHCKHASKA
jgi:hypothetical protein